MAIAAQLSTNIANAPIIEIVFIYSGIEVSRRFTTFMHFRSCTVGITSNRNFVSINVKCYIITWLRK